ncbi:MAG: hypothetical protein ABI806_20610 [Candidatus Solibacter sp.]
MSILHALVLVCLWAKLLWMGRQLSRGFPQRQAAASGTAALLILLAAPISLLGQGGQAVALLLVDVGLTALGLLDTWYLRFYGDVISIAGMKDAPQVRKVLPSVVALIRPSDFVLFLDMAALKNSKVMLS